MPDQPFSSAAILGTGSFGTALAVLLAPRLDAVELIGRDAQVVEAINQQHRNPRYLSHILLPERVRASVRLADAIAHPLVLFGVPTAATREVANDLASLGLPHSTVLLSCAKGIERDSGERMSEVLREVFPANPIAVFSGPNHAEEIATKLATCAVIGTTDPQLARQLQDLFTAPHFRSYTSDDLAGMELGGAIKNIYAIAAGIAAGLGLGDNAIAALVTRALAEMTRLGVALGGRAETFSGLSGVGDLIVTCFSVHSRNHRVGLALGHGKTLEEATRSLGMVAEGVPNTLSIHEAAHKAGVRTPIIDAVHSILYQHKPAAQAMHELLNRDPRPENA
ncbi:MAG: NAD(P)-dependent glycerol-3-phosphate dehydrogenase [Verrucomicrobia bacterium]|nr:MAG: NAD(P)-dependent glycerol-3-phosphate dehydrogenase [Verrucomicrobiota bacterium]TAE86217.1 MAG: NAD(P)-dependent glycerol-3-phosphate dehydrogenase [Verrucomicrobiota bacterium]TAF23663.1 MAG: NAD(P)-dependent glycerol-3-phosphate dehydrogenase [Verrucomicrobiota bacterium]TAF40206.1 MAG: NAD(P)-dependent glycerol-3-phosphate dehydrogenase [Verrucomicrobiota bacterium]